MFYEIDSTRVTYREYWWECRKPWMWPFFLIGVFVKVFRIRIPSSVDDATVESLTPFQVPESQLAQEVVDKFIPIENALVEIGFHSPVYHAIDDRSHHTQYRFASLPHDSNVGFARIHQRIWSRDTLREHFFPTFVTPFTDGTYLVSTAGKPDMLPPPCCHVNRFIGADVDKLWQAHRQAIVEEFADKMPVSIESQRKLHAAIEAFHVAHRDFHINRGVFVPRKEDVVDTAVESAPAPTDNDATEDDRFLKEIEALQQDVRRGWGRGMVMLAVSLVLFLSLGSAVWSWKFALMLVPVLLFHELGHFAAMKVFKYRNISMFFIPLFGAAVSGRHYNVAGWKKTVVSLMGPVPGIAAAVVIGTVGIYVEQAWLLQLALLTLILNGLNLLPVLPLDGGRIANTLLFSRHSVLESAFKILAVAALVLAGIAMGDPILWGLGAFMAVGIPWSLRIARIADELRREGAPAASPNDQSIPPETALATLEKLRVRSPVGIKTRQAAQLTLQVFERLNDRPPGWLATILLGGVQLASLLVAVVLAVVFSIAQHTDLSDFLVAAVAAPVHEIQPGEITTVQGAEAERSSEPKALVVGTLPSGDDADAFCQLIEADLPSDATVTRFGQTVLLALPAGDQPTRDHWLDEFESRASDVFIDHESFRGFFRLSCVAPDETTAEAIEQQVNQYATGMRLVPPWTTEYEVTAEQQKARRTYREMVIGEFEYAEDSRIVQLQKELARAQRRGQSETAEQLGMQQRDLIREIQQERLTRFRDRGPEVDRPLIDLYSERPVFPYLPDDDSTHDAVLSAHQSAMKSWRDQIADRLGQLPEGTDGRPVDAGESAESGYVVRNGLLLNVEGLQFHRIDRGAPAIVHWLYGLKCSNVNYSITAGTGLDYLEETID